jgi:hypothetical protein
MKQPTNIPQVETTYESGVYAELLDLSHQATALLVEHFRGLGHSNPEDAALHRLGDLADGKLYYETIIKMTNEEREKKLVVIMSVLANLRADKF